MIHHKVSGEPLLPQIWDRMRHETVQRKGSLEGTRMKSQLSIPLLLVFLERWVLLGRGRHWDWHFRIFVFYW